MTTSTPNLTHVHDAIPHEHVLTQVADTFSLLGDQSRLKILTALMSGPLKVREIAAVTHQSQSAVSHSLRLLRLQRVVTVTRNGRDATYELKDAHVRQLLSLALAHVVDEETVPTS